MKGCAYQTFIDDKFNSTKYDKSYDPIAFPSELSIVSNKKTATNRLLFYFVSIGNLTTCQRMNAAMPPLIP